jgi:S-adenosylmethionine:diacylglycerol 3-amino-3-carboxypropyl transferase
MRPQTAWNEGRFGSWTGPQRLLFGRMYEDADIEREAFLGKNRVFCIASAGTTALKLAHEREVVACDINPAQLAYAERRAGGAPPETGDAERAMRFIRALMPIVGWREKTLRKFLALSDVAEQTAFWSQYLDTYRFRKGFDRLLSPSLLHLMYAAPFLSFLPSNFGAVLRKRMERGFARHQNASNPYVGALLLGEIDEGHPEAVTNIRFVHADAASWLENCPPQSFDGFSLSNILDGAEPCYRSRLFRAVRHSGTENAVVVLRSFAEPSEDLPSNRAELDRSMLWGLVDVRKAQTL